MSRQEQSMVSLSLVVVVESRRRTRKWRVIRVQHQHRLSAAGVHCCCSGRRGSPSHPTISSYTLPPHSTDKRRRVLFSSTGRERENLERARVLCVPIQMGISAAEKEKRDLSELDPLQRCTQGPVELAHHSRFLSRPGGVAAGDGRHHAENPLGLSQALATHPAGSRPLVAKEPLPATTPPWP